MKNQKNFIQQKQIQKLFTVAKVHIKEAFLAKGFIDLIFLSPVLKTDSYPEKSR